MKSNKIHAHASAQNNADGEFINQAEAEHENYRICRISGVEIRVWGAENGKGLARELLSALRPVIRRIESCLPISLMADHHPAEAGVVGSVIVSARYAVPDLIGADCGCGVYAALTGMSLGRDSSETLRAIHRSIVEQVPVGRAQNGSVSPHILDMAVWKKLEQVPFISKHDIRRLQHQLGSLGGGNHFIELASDGEGRIWLLIHSGSRYLGGLLRERFKGKALLLGSDEAAEFFEVQRAVMEFARLSREEMARRVLLCLKNCNSDSDFVVLEEIDLAHNFVENSTDSSVAVHRKGACAAAEHQRGIVPGSMGSYSYVVEGRGNPASYSSSSHGAGRRFSRGDAFRKLSSRQLFEDMQGIVWDQSEKLKDESPRAYKNIEGVMRAQSDLVRICHRLEPILSVKGLK